MSKMGWSTFLLEKDGVQCFIHSWVCVLLEHVQVISATDCLVSDKKLPNSCIWFWNP